MFHYQCFVPTADFAWNVIELAEVIDVVCSFYYN